MIGKKINSSRYAPLYEAKDILKARSEEGELTYEQNLTYAYSKKFSKISKAKGEKLLQELKKIEAIDDLLAIKLVDILPNDLDELNLIIQKNVKLEETVMQDILKIIKKYRKK